MRIVAIALTASLSMCAASCASHAQNDAEISARVHSSLRMPDGNEWLTENLRLDTAESYCFGNREANCRRYGRLYTWESAQRACRSLGDRWRLPTDDDWRALASHYGGAYDGAEGSGKSAYRALLAEGGSGFNAVFGGGRGSMTASTMIWKPTASTGPRRKSIRRSHRSTTSLAAEGLCIVNPTARSRSHSPSAACASASEPPSIEDEP